MRICDRNNVKKPRNDEIIARIYEIIGKSAVSEGKPIITGAGYHGNCVRNWGKIGKSGIYDRNSIKRVQKKKSFVKRP